MISSPLQQKGPHTIPTLPNKKPNAKPYPSQQKGPARSQPFFNRKSMQFSQRSSITESDRFP